MMSEGQEATAEPVTCRVSDHLTDLGDATMIDLREQHDELRDAVAGVADEVKGLRREMRRIADALERISRKTN